MNFIEYLKNNNFKKIVLYHPVHQKTTGASYVAGYLENLDFTIKTTPKNLENFDVILFSWSSWKDYQYLKNLPQRKTIIIGGNIPTQFIDSAQKKVKKNYVFFQGDINGEIIKIEKNVISAFYCYKANITPKVKPFLKLDPAYHWGMVYSGRGCSWGKCTFCIDHEGKRLTEFCPQKIGKEVNRQFKAFYRCILLSCPCHTVDWLIEMEKHISDNRRIYYAMMRADQMKFSKLKKCRKVFMGMEYLSDPVLKRINKGYDVKRIFTAFEELLTMHIHIDTNFIIDLYQNEDEKSEHEENLLKMFDMSRLTSSKGTFSFYIGKLHEAELQDISW